MGLFTLVSGGGLLRGACYGMMGLLVGRGNVPIAHQRDWYCVVKTKGLQQEES